MGEGWLFCLRWWKTLSQTRDPLSEEFGSFLYALTVDDDDSQCRLEDGETCGYLPLVFVEK